MRDLFSSATQLAQQFRAGTKKVGDVIQQLFTHIDQTEPKVQSYLHLFKEAALEKASELDEKFKKGDPLPPLAGVPISIKDNLMMTGTPTTCGSQFLKDFVSPYDATVITKILNHGLIPIGKTNMDEFAMGSSTENSSYQNTKNPWNLNKVPGGSSGGSAASVAAGEAWLSLGSDTGGSIRQPAAFCGLVGLKPSYGRVSRFGLVAFASSLDQIGPITRTVEDAALLLSVIAGHDANDATSANQALPNITEINRPLTGKKIAVLAESFDKVIDPDIQAAFSAACEILKSDGATLETVTLPALKYVVPTYYILAPAEASANLARFDGVRYTTRDESATTLQSMIKKSRGQGFGPEVKRRIILGTYVLSSGYYDAYYAKAQKVRNVLTAEMIALFEKYDAILCPTTPNVSFGFGEKSSDPWQMYIEDMLTIPANLAGIPALSIPCGQKNGLPIGLQLMSKHFAESTILNMGHRYQQLSDWHLKTPEGITS